MIKKVSEKQLKVLNFWRDHNNGIICDGAIRSGKTLSASMSFIEWAMSSFENESFALCGKTISALHRNVTTPLIPLLSSAGYTVELGSVGFTVKRGKTINSFFFFGGRDEDAYPTVAEIKFAGAFFDEVALMPRSFVELGIAWCGAGNCKVFFTCNPEHPYHWFYNEWIKKAEERNMVYVQFTMDDNPTLSDELKTRYKNLYSGAFYERFIEGKWVSADGLIYPMFSEDKHIKSSNGFNQYFVSCDYGTINPFSLGLWGRSDEGWFRIKEYYHSSRDRGIQLTDEEYYSELKKLTNGINVSAIIVDPCAASFIETINKHKEFAVIKAKNNVVDGINDVANALEEGKLFFFPTCENAIREFSLYRWNNAATCDAPRKENDHAMDDIRYFVATLTERGDFSW